MTRMSWKSGYSYLLIGMLAFLSYANTIGHDFAWDDVIVITENSRVQKGWGGLKELFINKRLNKTEYQYGYRPITLLTFATEVEFFGLNPHVFHVVNVLLYTLLCVVLLIVMTRMFQQHAYLILAAVVLFAVHPLHTEVVANIKSRDEILAMLFSLLSFYGFLRFMETSQWRWVPVSLGFLILGFLSKESAATILGIIAISVYYRSSKLNGYFFSRIAILSLFAIVVIFVRAWSFSDVVFQSNDSELLQKGVFHYDVFLGNPLVSADSLIHRVANGFFLLWYYLSKAVYPWPLVHDYGYSQLEVKMLHSNSLWIVLSLVFMLFVYTFFELRKRSVQGFGLAWFSISVAIYLQLFALTPDLFAERYAFVGLFGLMLVLAALLSELVKSKNIRIGLVSVSATVFILGTFQRNKAWANNETLYETDMPNLQKCARSLYNYGLFNHAKYYDSAPSEKPKLKEKILSSYERALEITNRAIVIHMDLGSAYMEFGQPEKAYKVFKEAQMLFWKMSIPYVQLGKYHMSFANYDSGYYYFEKAIEYGSSNPDYYYLAAVCQFKLSNDSLVLDLLAKGEPFAPDGSGYYTLMARAYLRSGNTEEARRSLEAGLGHFPNDSDLIGLLRQIPKDEHN